MIKLWNPKSLLSQDWYKNGAVQYIASNPDHKSKYKYIIVYLFIYLFNYLFI